MARIQKALGRNVDASWYEKQCSITRGWNPESPRESEPPETVLEEYWVQAALEFGPKKEEVTVETAIRTLPPEKYDPNFNLDSNYAMDSGVLYNYLLGAFAHPTGDDIDMMKLGDSITQTALKF
ncbi:hypothetical protein ABW20_dc0108663 [Dactylellina cionopaga]|nr:hypothetical protein ABW20_dc0108663 [Dactylellina cionopaga]